MGRSPCCAKEGLNRGAWTALEDKILTDFIKAHGEGRWRNLPKRAGLKRCGKSCRLRWLNYLRPDIKRGNISQDEEELIIRLHKLLGNRWSLIAGRLPGRTDNEIKNYWNTNLCKKVLETNSAASPSRSKRTQTLHKPTQPEPRVFRTKAVRCSQVFIKPPAPAVDDPIKPEPPAAHFCANADDIPMLDFLLDFNLGELCSSEFFNPDFSDLRALANDDNSATYNMNVLSPDFSLSQEILPDLIPGTGTSAVEGAQSDTAATSSGLLAFASSLDCQGDLDDFVLENS